MNRATRPITDAVGLVYPAGVELPGAGELTGNDAVS
jgi:hypothetical protein